METKTVRGIGLMSGTSLDGLDIACCDFHIKGDAYSYDLVKVGQVPFDERWRSRLANLIGQSAETYAKTHVYFGHWLGKETQNFIESHKLKPDFVAAHGQTIFHQPHKNFTAQIGDGETIVSYLDCPLVSNFRNKDVALEGEGAPFIPIAEKYLFPNVDMFLNLGGFSNISFQQRAYDISACNIVLNFLVQHATPPLLYDDNGALAAKGKLHPSLYDALNQLPYFSLSPPKSLGWEWVVEQVLPILQSQEISLEDKLHTFVCHAAFQIQQAIKYLKAEKHTLLITGGGRHNLFLIHKIEELLGPLDIKIVESISPEMIDYKEAIGFAFMGLRVLEGKNSNMASVTGATQDALCGSIHLPANSSVSLI